MLMESTATWWKLFRLRSFTADIRANFAKKISDSDDLRLITKLAEAVKDDGLYTLRLTVIVALGEIRDTRAVECLVNTLLFRSAMR